MMELFSIIASYFSESADALIGCTEPPQASSRDNNKKVIISIIISWELTVRIN